MGADAATSLLVASSSDGDMLLQVRPNILSADDYFVWACTPNNNMYQPRMTQLLATLVPAMFEAWNKVPPPFSPPPPPICFLSHYLPYPALRIPRPKYPTCIARYFKCLLETHHTLHSV